MPEEEWNFLAGPKKLPNAHELNAFLNYEYARSCRPIVEAVDRIRRKQPSTESIPRFAVFLEKTFPEFPAKPWMQIAPARRGKLRAQEIIPRVDPFKDRVPLRVHDVNEFVCHVNAEDIALGNIGAARFAVLDIDFDVDDPGIVERFAKWLAQRREELNARYAPPTVLPPGNQTPPPLPFEPKLPPPSRGQKLNCRQYKNYLKGLAALRLLRFYPDWEEAQVRSQCGGKSLYTGQRSWQRASEQAADLMMRFVSVWKCEWGFPFILDPNRFLHSFLPSRCCAPIPPTDDQMGRMREEIRAFIATQVLPFE